GRRRAAPMTRRRAIGLAAALVAVGSTALVGCGGGGTSGASSAAPRRSVPSATAVTVPPTAPPTALPTLPPTPPAPGAPAFAAAPPAVSAPDLGASWHDGCPVGPDQLRRLSLTYWDFDGQLRTGALVVNADVVDPVTAVFRRLFDERVPIRRMETIDKYG